MITPMVGHEDDTVEFMVTTNKDDDDVDDGDGADDAS